MKEITIKNNYGEVIYQCQADSIKDAVEKAVKEGISLRNIDLSGKALSGANLRGADLSGANLRGTNLRGANLICADLRGADLRDANLSGANLSCVNLRRANLSCANLGRADLIGANLWGANLWGADLRGINISDEIIIDIHLDSVITDKRYIQISCIGSRKDLTTYCFDDDIIFCGCFKGSLNDFEQKCIETHKDNPQYLKEYIEFIEYIRKLK